jgi:hypothetical protein
LGLPLARPVSRGLQSTPQKLRIELLPLAGDELQQIIRSIQDLSPDLTQKIKSMYPN